VKAAIGPAGKGSRTLVLAPSLSQMKEVVRLARGKGSTGNNVVVAAEEPAVEDAVRQAGLQFSHLDSYPGADEPWAEAARLSRNWYWDSAQDLSSYKGMSLGGISEVDMFVFFSRLLEDVERLERLLSAVQPDIVWLGADARPSWPRLLPGFKPQLRIHRLGGSARSAARSMLRRPRFKEWLKEASFDRQSRAFVLAVRRPTSRVPAPQPMAPGGRGNILVVADIPTPSVLGSLLPVIRALPPDATFVLATDPRVLSRLEGIDAFVVSATLADLAASWGPYRTAVAAFRKRWTEFRSTPEHERISFRHHGIDLWPMLAPRLRRIFLRQFPFTFAETAVAATILRRYRIKTIVTASHAHYAGRLYCEVGAALGVPSLSLQHGVAGVPTIYAPVHSTKMAVWGELPRLWLIANGADPDQLVVTGQPRLDALLSPGPPLTRTEVLSRLGLDPSRPIWTVAPDPEPREVRHAMTEMIDSIASEFPVPQVIVRPHPDDDDSHYAGRLASWIGEGRIALGIELDAASLLAASDLVFVGQSTLGLEAMVLGRPVVVLDPCRSFEFVPYVREGAAPVVHEAAELVPVITGLLGPDRIRFEDGRKSFVERYASAADGRSTDRVVDLIGTMARGTS
jgi:hypothetical protein